MLYSTTPYYHRNNNNIICRVGRARFYRGEEIAYNRQMCAEDNTMVVNGASARVITLDNWTPSPRERV